jgi:hypothetical protein
MQAFVKVSMDGTPYLRKVDVAAYDDYGELVEALNELFCCCSIGKLAAMLCEIDQDVLSCIYKPRTGRMETEGELRFLFRFMQG